MINAQLVKDASGRSEKYDLNERMSGFIQKLEDEANRRVQQRNTIENRWIEDLLQYHGKYNETDQKRLNKYGGSFVFKNRTRPKTNAMIARLTDLLFPTDDRNWSIQPTPVPEMQEADEETSSLADDSEDTFADLQRRLREAEGKGEDGEAEAQQLAAEMEQADEIRTESQRAADELMDERAEASRRARLMEAEIEDQQKACRYAAEARDVIEDACKIGIGIMKGPVLGGKVKTRWQKTEDGQHELVQVASNYPSYHWVDPWSFFPSMDAKKPEDSEGFYERHLLNKTKLRKMAYIPSVDKDAIRALLSDGPDQGSAPSYLVDLRNLTMQNENETDDLYKVWEYTGPIDAEHMELLAEAERAGIDDMAPENADKVAESDALFDDIKNTDPLHEWHVRVQFCQNRLISFGVHPLDSNEPIYSVYNLEKDEASMFGFGIPYLTRDDQDILNSSWRMMMDNGGYSVGPQIVVDEDAVTPKDGDPKIRSMKVWTKKKSDFDPRNPPFQTYDIPSNQQYLANVIVMAAKDMDDVSSLPEIAQGEQGTGVTKTAQGMALLMNSANVLFKRFVKNFDDDITVPNLRRQYDWNMQFSDKEEIKGDYEVDARGSSVLLVREMQANNLMLMANLFGDHPVYGEWIRHEELLKSIMRAHMISADEIVKSEREVMKSQKEQAAQQDPVAALEMEKLQIEKDKIDVQREKQQLDSELANAELDTKRRIAELEYAGKMQISIEELNLKSEDIEAKSRDKTEAAAIKASSDERKLATEVAMRDRTGVSAGGSV